MTSTSLTSKRLALRALTFLFVGALLLLPTLRGNASPGPNAGAPKVNKYIGAEKCKSCHDAEASGNQHGLWLERGHAQAFKTLLTDDAKRIAAERGIKDASKSDDCLKCHQTAFGVNAKELKKSFDPTAGVGCEVCHGPGDKHARARFRAANEGEEEEEGFGDEEEEIVFVEIPVGEIGMDITRDLCKECHNTDSPTYKPFCFVKRAEEARHLNPMKPRTAKELAAILVCGKGEECTCDSDCNDGCAVPPKPKK